MNNNNPQKILRRLSGPYRDHAYYPSDKLKQIQQAKRLAVYGHGSGYNSFKAFILNKFDIKIHAVIDAKFTGITKINDITYIATQQFIPPHTNTKLLDSIDLVVVSIGDKSQAETVKRFLLDAGIRDVLWSLDIPEYHFTHTSKIIIYESTREILSCESEILEAYKFLQDSESRRIFITLLENYAFGNIKQIISRDISLQYNISKSDLIMDNNFNLFVDVGAHFGETIVDIFRSASGGSIKQVIAFEPDPNNFKKLKLNVSSISDVEMHLYENACIDTDRKLLFSSALGVNSTRRVYGGELNVIEVDGVALDFLYGKFDFSNALIKFDIEGSELQALSGARRLLQDFKPTLMVSVYHDLGDLWKIILFLKSLEIPYKFWLRNYTGFAAETVLYASI